MKLGGNMIVSYKDLFKLMGIIITSCCTVCVCTMFLNYIMDLKAIKDLLLSNDLMTLYNAQVNMSNAICIITGCVLCITSVIMLVFYIKNYIDNHRKELGILKALGYNNFKLSLSFFVFGLSVLIGTILGYIIAWILIPSFYDAQNKDGFFPELTYHFHPILVLFLIIIPTLLFALFSIIIAYKELKRPVMSLLKNKDEKEKNQKISEKEGLSFLKELKRNTLLGNKILIFFVIFACFCYSAMVQMAISMFRITSANFGLMILIIGLILAITTMMMAIATIIKGNIKTIALMNAFGYLKTNYNRYLLGCYRPMSWIGFVLGTIYQYVLLKLVFIFIFDDVMSIDYHFDIKAFLITLLSFVIIYEGLMSFYSKRFEKIHLKNIMND